MFDYAVRVARYTTSKGECLSVSLGNDLEKEYKTGRVRVVRKCDLLYLIDDVRGMAISDYQFQIGRQEYVQDLARFEGIYDELEYGGKPGYYYIDFKKRKDAEYTGYTRRGVTYNVAGRNNARNKIADATAVSDESSIVDAPTESMAEAPKVETPSVEAKQPVQESQPSINTNMSNLVMAAIKDGELDVANALVKVIDWMNRRGMLV